MHNSLSKKSRPIVVLLAFAAAAGFFMINLVNPNSFATADASVRFAHVTDRFAGQQPQAIDVNTDFKSVTVQRDEYSASLKVTPKPKPTPTPTTSTSSQASTSQAVAAAPAEAVPTGSPQAWAQSYLTSLGMGADQFNCLVQVFNRESGWNVHASNPSGAYGIPQALPGSKMSSAGPDWQDNYQTQIKWGVSYVDGRYGSPCDAWSYWQAHGYY